MEQETKILLGATVVGAAIAGYFWWKKLQAASGAPALPSGAPHPLSNLGVAPPASQARANGMGVVAPGLAPSPGAGPTAHSYFSTMAAPVAMSPAAPTQTPLPQDGNYVQTNKGLFTWAQGGSYDSGSGMISNRTNAPLAITTPSGPLTLSPGMTYNVGTGEIGF